jgi:alpha-beta hydrolase superfamily lysophospholipase
VIAPEYLRYTVAGHDAFCLSFGTNSARRIVIVPPLFDEMNRMRRVLVSAMRDLAERGVGSVLIDLPGCNESLAPLEAQNLYGWRDAVQACATQLAVTHIASFRGGALIDGCHPDLPHWRLAPVKGASLLKTMIRTRIAGEKEAGNNITEAELTAQATTAPIELAGNMLGPEMVEQLAVAEPAALPQLTGRQLGEDITGSPLWLRAEPQDDPAFAANIAADLDRWSASCGG